MQHCINCNNFAGTESESECYLIGDSVPIYDTCDDFVADPTRFCGICNAKAIDAPHGLQCIDNRDHFASQWDLIWHDIND